MQRFGQNELGEGRKRAWSADNDLFEDDATRRFTSQNAFSEEYAGARVAETTVDRSDTFVRQVKVRKT